MDKICITGGTRLTGTIEISGAKNAALPLMAASLLTDQPITLTNIPHLTDISTMANLLIHMGVELGVDGTSMSDGHVGRVLILRARTIKDHTAPYDIVRKMRASALVLGPLLARESHARVSLPGGCAIGTRPINLHLTALEAMGAEVELSGGYINARVPAGRLKGAKIDMPMISVGATENVLMAASLAKGTTVLKNAAREPEVTDLANMLVKMGVPIEGIDTHTLTIHGVDALKPTEYRVLPDRIEAGTYAVAAAITGGDLELLGADAGTMGATLDMLRETGAEVSVTPRGIRVKRDGPIRPVNISTEAYPGFATDMQAQFMALATLAEGSSVIAENIFENRFMHVPEMGRMGAHIDISHNTATVHGVKELRAAEVMATDLRASVSLVLTALAAQGTTTINRVYHIDRGYERIEEKLGYCGALIERVKG